MIAKRGEFVELIKNTFKKCYEVRPGLYRTDSTSIENMLLSSLSMDSGLEDMIKSVAHYFDDPSSYGTDQCSELFMKAIEPFRQEESYVLEGAQPAQEVQGHIAEISYEEL